MKKIVSLKLIIFSLLLVAGSVSYSAPAIEPGTGANSTKAGVDNTADGEESSAFGFKNITDKSGSSAFGNGNVAIGDFSSAFGFHNIANKEHSSAFGSSNEADGDFSSAFGFKNKISGKWSSAFGNQYEVTGEKSGTFGVGNFNGQYQNKNEGNNSYMIGNYNKIAKDSNDNFILGNNVTIGAGVQKSVVLGDGSASGGSNTVSVGSATLKRKIVNVGDGEISANSTDAVTGKQLHGIAKATSNDIDVDAWKAKLGVGAGGVDLTVYAKRNASNLTASDISDWQTKLDITKKADYKDANGIDVNKWRTRLGVGSGGGAGGGAPVDAYTKSEADNKFTSKDDYRDANGIDVDKWKAKLGTGAGSADIQNLRNEVYERIDNVKDEVRDVGSLSAALAGLHPMQYDPKAPAQVMAALGQYKNKQSVAVGLSYYFNDRFMMSAGVALSGEKKTKSMANVGFTLKLGKGSGVTYNETPLYTIQDEVKRLTVENNKQAKENQELKERVRNLEEKLNMLLKNK